MSEPSRLLCPWDSPGKNTGVGCHSLLQGIFLTQGLNPRLCVSCIGRRVLYRWHHLGRLSFPYHIYIYIVYVYSSWVSLVAQTVKHLPIMRETWVRSLGQEDPLEKEMATHPSIHAWKIPWTEEPGRLQSMGSQRAGHDSATSLHNSLPRKNTNAKTITFLPEYRVVLTFCD